MKNFVERAIYTSASVSFPQSQHSLNVEVIERITTYSYMKRSNMNFSIISSYEYSEGKLIKYN